MESKTANYDVEKNCGNKFSQGGNPLTSQEIKEYFERNQEAKVRCEKLLDEELKKNRCLKELFEKHPEKREQYIFKMMDSNF